MGLFFEEHPNIVSPLLRCEPRCTIYDHGQVRREPFDRCFGILPFEAKISNIRSYARIALDLFRIDAPNGIGSISSFKSNADGGELVLGPYILPSGLHTPSSVFQSIEDYFMWLTSVKMTSTSVGTARPDLDEAQVTLKRLESLISKSVSGYNDAAFLRGVPSYQDFCAQTFSSMAKALSQVSLTGSSTWSNRLCWPQPIHLGFATMESLTLGSLIKKDDFLRSGRLVRSMQKNYERNTMQYVRALKAGEFCRMAEEWLLNEGMDIGCRRMKAWVIESTVRRVRG